MTTCQSQSPLHLKCIPVKNRPFNVIQSDMHSHPPVRLHSRARVFESC